MKGKAWKHSSAKHLPGVVSCLCLESQPYTCLDGDQERRSMESRIGGWDVGEHSTNPTESRLAHPLDETANPRRPKVRGEIPERDFSILEPSFLHTTFGSPRAVKRAHGQNMASVAMDQKVSLALATAACRYDSHSEKASAASKKPETRRRNERV